MQITSIDRYRFGPEQCLTGVSAALAEARQVFRKAAPGVPWTEVTAAANQVRAAQPMTMLEALNVVFARLAEGR